MLIYIVRRLLWAPVVLLAVSLFTFTLGHYGPGDPVEVLLGQHNNPEVVDRIRKERGLDRPFHVQYTDYVWKALQGDFGESFAYRGTPVKEVIFQKVWVSFQLNSVAFVLSLIIGVPLGLFAALNQGRRADRPIVISALFVSSVPVFILYPFLILIFVRWLHLLPTSGWEGLFSPKIVMPALVLTLGPIGILTRLMRASTLDVVGQDYVRTARAKGLLERTVRIDHISRNAILPVFTVVGLSLATLIEGAFVVETLFGIPGIGRLAVDSLFARDYPIITALTLMVAVAYILANLLVDIGYTFVDPRIRYR